MTTLKLWLLALMLLAPVVSALAQTDDGVITVDECRARVAQYGIPDADPIVAFQGGSLEAQVVAFCQSLAYRGARDGVGLEQKLRALADRDQNGTIDRTELDAYFAAAPSSASTESPPPGDAQNLPAAGIDSRAVTSGILLGFLAAVLVTTGAGLVLRRSR